LQFNLSKSDGLARFQYRLGDFFSVDECAVCGIQILDDDIISTQEDFAMMARN